MRKTKYMGFPVWNNWGWIFITNYTIWHRKDMDRKYMDNELRSKLYKNDYKEG